jgi:hypothetical protein
MQYIAPILFEGIMQRWSESHASILKCSSKGDVNKINVRAKLPVGSKGSPHASWKKWRSSCRGNEYQEGEGKHYCDGIARWWN